MKYKIAALMSLLILSGCFKPEHLKTVSWHNHGIEWSEVRGSATTPDLWMIHYKKNNWSGKKLIFQSISSPFIKDITVNGDNLFIHISDSQFLHIHLDKIEDFIDDPVKYRDTSLEQTNSSYHEPDFIKKDRENSIKWGLIKR